MSYDFVCVRVSQLKKSGKLSSKQLQKAEKSKKDNKYSEVYEIIILMLSSGCTQQDIAKKLNKSQHFVSDRINELKQNGRISNKSMQKAKEERLQREKQLRAECQLAKSLLLEKRMIDGPNCAKFVSSCREMFKINLLPVEDIPLLRKAVEYTDITQYTISFMLKVYLSFKQYDEATKFLNSCIGYLTEDLELIDMAKRGKLAIIYYQKQQQAVDMLKSGNPIDYVFRRVGLTESEVIELKKKYVDWDSPQRIPFDYFEI